MPVWLYCCNTENSGSIVGQISKSAIRHVKRNGGELGDGGLGLQVLAQAGHEFHEVAGPVAGIELVA